MDGEVAVCLTFIDDVRPDKSSGKKEANRKQSGQRANQTWPWLIPVNVFIMFISLININKYLD